MRRTASSNPTQWHSLISHVSYWKGSCSYSSCCPIPTVLKALRVLRSCDFNPGPQKSSCQNVQLGVHLCWVTLHCIAWQVKQVKHSFSGLHKDVSQMQFFCVTRRALEGMLITKWSLANLTDVTLVSEDTYWRVYWCGSSEWTYLVICLFHLKFTWISRFTWFTWITQLTRFSWFTWVTLGTLVT